MPESWGCVELREAPVANQVSKELAWCFRLFLPLAIPSPNHHHYYNFTITNTTTTSSLQPRSPLQLRVHYNYYNDITATIATISTISTEVINSITSTRKSAFMRRFTTLHVAQSRKFDVLDASRD
ncbi:uncharacterized protein GIQ15_06572 [Arthroderma uncinatum]|uniref:uncharacterized protein n=1 Tax=Arthroderma uncinatum TaxID=74035 RepID=UPI00144AB288|nr:uncharacterized protein GIQ15_06572 [Arthroderma uncinatum]KAF3479596.1 hypothetical protein GIQ15_06572 [Arthroderma uncinatum]